MNLLEACAAPASEVAAVQLVSCWDHCGHGLEPVVHLQNNAKGHNLIGGMPAGA